MNNSGKSLVFYFGLAFLLVGLLVRWSGDEALGLAIIVISVAVIIIGSFIKKGLKKDNRFLNLKEEPSTDAAPVNTGARDRMATLNPDAFENLRAHYVLKCRSCGFLHHIPADYEGSTVRYSVDPDALKMTCVYGGGAFTVTLTVKEFFAIEPSAASSQVLHASIGDNVKALHAHMLSHCDPLFMQVTQTRTSTHHTYTRAQPRATPFVQFSGAHGIDIVGDIDVRKAEIPGMS